MKFRTVSGSIYEIEQENNRIRRLSGTIAPTERQGSDGEWKEYMYATVLTLNKPLIITWKINEDGSLNSTITSLVKELL